MGDQLAGGLIRYTKETYEGSYSTDLLEQYKLYVQSADNESARRVASGSYFLTLNTALIALYGIQSAIFGQSFWILLVPVLGVVISIFGYQIIKSYRDLNKAKFEVIHELEQHLPAALFDYEWKIVEQGKGKSYKLVTYLEQRIPIVFIALHSLIVVIHVYHLGLLSW